MKRGTSYGNTGRKVETDKNEITIQQVSIQFKILNMNKKIILITYLLASLFITGCSEDKDGGMQDGNMVAVRVPIEGIGDRPDESSATRSAGEDAEPITVTQELEDGLVMESVLTAETVKPAKTRATDLNSNVYILTYVYKKDGTLYKYEVFTPANPVIHLPQGQKFKLVFYSYNSPDVPAMSITHGSTMDISRHEGFFPEGARLKPNTEFFSRNAMWTKIDETPTITPATTLPGITFRHLFARVEWTVISMAGRVKLSKATLTPSYQKANVRTDDFENLDPDDKYTAWTPIGTSDFKTPFSPLGAGMTLSSGALAFIPDETKSAMRIDVSMNINEQDFSNKTITFTKALKRGVWYKVTSTIRRTCTITFQSEDTSKGTVSPDGTQSVTAWGEELSSTPSAPASPDDVFDGWYSSEDGYVKKLETREGKYTIGAGNKLTVIMGQETEGRIYKARYISKSDCCREEVGLKDGMYHTSKSD